MFLYLRVLNLSQVLEHLVKYGKITDDVAKHVLEFIHQNQTQLPTLKINVTNKDIPMSIRQRFQTIMKDKQSNLCLSADLTSLNEIIEVNLWNNNFV